MRSLHRLPSLISHPWIANLKIHPPRAHPHLDPLGDHAHLVVPPFLLASAAIHTLGRDIHTANLSRRCVRQLCPQARGPRPHRRWMTCAQNPPEPPFFFVRHHRAGSLQRQRMCMAQQMLSWGRHGLLCCATTGRCAGGGWRPRTTELEERSPHRTRPRAGHCAQQKLSAPMCSTRVLLLPPQRVPSARPMHAASLWSGAACLLIRRDLNPRQKRRRGEECVQDRCSGM
mmetsp:Transcript_50112/g.80879  ORF Transcript_50112/g.80879 Transcript_50112/m.80879 type:complete len:229 (-) Transcript_50112:91-777(-)